jgi:hypothetical protein
VTGPDDRRPGLLWPLVLYALGAAFVAWHVRLLEKPEIETGRLVQYAALAALPALVAVWRGRRVERTWLAGAVVALVTAVGMVTGHWPLRPHLLGDTGYFVLVAEEFWNGGYQWTQVVLPVRPRPLPRPAHGDHPGRLRAAERARRRAPGLARTARGAARRLRAVHGGVDRLRARRP